MGILEEQNDHKRHAPGLPESRGITHPYNARAMIDWSKPELLFMMLFSFFDILSK